MIHLAAAILRWKGDEIGVKADRCAVGDDLKEIPSRGRLAAGKMRMQHAERGGLGKHPLPGFRVEFDRAGFELQRIGAIRAAERAAMREFGEKPDGVWRFDRGVHRSTIRLAASPLSSARTSSSILARSAA
jgi:hypothetical protein